MIKKIGFNLTLFLDVPKYFNNPPVFIKLKNILFRGAKHIDGMLLLGL